jgi:sugar (pentulose or hexulose) kinase
MALVTRPASADVLVAVDVGTSGARAVAFDLDGRRLLEIRRAYPTREPRPGWAEQSAGDWRSASLASLAELVGRLGSGDRVRAISLTGQCPSVVLVDDRGRAIGPGLTYRDNRATVEAGEIRARYGDASMHARTGHRPSAFHIAPKLLWLRRHDPAGWRRAALVLQPRDWVVLALTGQAVTDGTHAAATLLYDLRRRRWDDGLLADLDLAPGLLPRIGRPDEAVGTLRPRIATRLGLAASTMVVLGGADSQACAFGAGVVGPGPVSEMAGSSTCLNAVVAEPLAALDVTHYPHVIGGDFTTETGINTTGATIAWVADRLYGGRRGRAGSSDYARLDAEAATIARGADGLRLVPVLGGGERTDAALRGAITGLSLRHDRASVARAAMEGVAFAIRAQLELLRAGGAPVTELRVSGGDTRLATWNRIKADVTGLVVRTIPGDAATAGVAMLAGLGAAVYRDPADAIARCVRPSPSIEPDHEAVDWYAPAYRSYQALVESSVVRREEG